jgi:hypothetical protein
VIQVVVSTIEPEQLVESLGKEKVVLIPLSEYQALLDRLKELENNTALLQAKIEHQVKHKLATIADSQAALAPVTLKGAWGPVVVDGDSFSAASVSSQYLGVAYDSNEILLSV